MQGFLELSGSRTSRKRTGLGGGNSLLQANLQGISTKEQGRGPIHDQESRRKQPLLRQIPCAAEQGIFSGNQGSAARVQGLHFR